MSIKINMVCPLGSKCESIKGEEIERCAWFVSLQGENPQTGEIMDEKGCAMHWLPLLLVEGSKFTRHTAAAVESLRNEVVKAAYDQIDHNSLPPVYVEYK